MAISVTRDKLFFSYSKIYNIGSHSRDKSNEEMCLRISLTRIDQRNESAEREELFVEAGLI